MSHKTAKRERMQRRTKTARSVHAGMLRIMTDLRRVFARRLKDQRQRFPKMVLPCDTCAFRTSTDEWQGMEKTALTFVTALARGAEFFYHKDLEEGPDGWLPALDADGRIDYDRMPLCSAWFVLSAEPPFHLSEIGLDDETVEKLCELQMAEKVCEVPA